MKPLPALVFIFCLSLCAFGQKQHAYLIEECVSKGYTQNSCDKVFCQGWQRCVRGSCLCKLPYQCPKNGSLVCSNGGMTFRTYCQLKSYECQRNSNSFVHRGSCSLKETFQVVLDPENASSEGIVQVKLNQPQKKYICGEGWTIHEANVVCRELGFPEGADLIQSDDADNLTHPLQCLQATCRGIETSLAECTTSQLNQNNQKVAKVMCHTQHKECSPREFRCVNQKCIPSRKTCDGINDCGDLSDEVCCKVCRGKSFHCKSDVCIPNQYLCNNERDCLTGEDESSKLCEKRLKTEPVVPNQHSFTEAAENHTEATGEAGHVAVSMDEERKRIKTLYPQPYCGIANHTVTRRKRILGGNTAEKHEFPWQVAIKGERERISCGGVYIGGCWVLTAAHCVRASRAHVYKVFTGMLNSINVTKGTIVAYNLKKVIVHENYNSKTYENDIALLEMKPNDMGKCYPIDTVPVCVPWSKYMFKGGEQCKVSGWGYDADFTRQYALKWGYIYLMENCSEIYKNRYFEGMECAGTHDGSVDSCKGDSGGPMVCFDSNNVGYVWGIVSWGENCGVKGFPGVYTKVANYFDWIGRYTGMSLIAQHNQ
ncbi:complement factor I [Pogona vitticeps]